MKNLIKNTAAFKIFAGDKRAGRLSHAYELNCKDEIMAPEYAKAFCKLALCKSDDFCDECRTCRLIEKNAYADASFYPAALEKSQKNAKNDKADKGEKTEKNEKNSKKILASDVDDLIAQTYIKPLENERRVFVLNNAESMTVSAQNKLLKTLEEPPAGVIIILCVSNEYSLLPTVKSRVKRLDIPAFSADELFNAYRGEAPDDVLASAVAASGGKEGELLRILNGGEALSDELAYSVLLGMKNTRRMLEYSSKIDKDNVRSFWASLKRAVFKCVEYKALENSGDEASKLKLGEYSPEIARIAAEYPSGCLLKTIEKINSAERALFFNGNATMVADGVLLTLLEEKHRWLKL